MTRSKSWGKRRSTRLQSFDYTAPGVVYHVILRAARRRHVFTKSDLNRSIVEVIKEACRLHGYRLIAYCLMPDHLHLLVQCGQERRNLAKFVGALKSYSSRVAGRKLWQRGFYEHVLRTDEQPRVRLGHSGQQFPAWRHGHGPGALGDRKLSRAAPVGLVALLVLPAVTPGVRAGRKNLARAVYVHRDLGGPVLDRLEPAAATALQLPAHHALLRSPTKARWSDFQLRARTRL